MPNYFPISRLQINILDSLWYTDYYNMNWISYQYEEYKRYLADLLFLFIKDLYILFFSHFFFPYTLLLAGHSCSETSNLSMDFK